MQDEDFLAFIQPNYATRVGSLLVIILFSRENNYDTTVLHRSFRPFHLIYTAQHNSQYEIMWDHGQMDRMFPMKIDVLLTLCFGLLVITDPSIFCLLLLLSLHPCRERSERGSDEYIQESYA